MAIPGVHQASLSFRLRVLDPVAMSQHRDAVMDSFGQFIQAYDPGLTKGQAWLGIQFKVHHDWAVAQATSTGVYDPAAFQAAYALAASEVFFLHGVDTSGGWDTTAGTGLPHPSPGTWGPTSLQAVPNELDGAIYVWEYNSNTGNWERVCYGDFALVDPSGAGPVSPDIVIGGVKIASVEASLAYGEQAAL